MNLYKKQVRFYSIFSNGMGFKDEIEPITDWIDEDKIDNEIKRKIEEISKNPFTTVRQKTNYVFVKEEEI